MRPIFAEYNPQRNSIDIYFTDVGRCRRFLDIIVMFKKSSLCNAQELFICRPLFICAVCINYRLNLLHKGIIVVLVINSAEHWFAYNIAISVNKYSCWKGHDF